jgi:hypothetical protein
MQPTYYERLLANRELDLESTLDGDIAQLKAASLVLPEADDSGLADRRSRYILAAIAQYKRTLASGMSAEEFERFRQTPSYHEVLVQQATQQYWTYDTFLYLRAHGERTLYIGFEAAAQLLAEPLEIYGEQLALEAPAEMLVFESPDMVDALYAGDRRARPGRNHGEAQICVLALEMPRKAGARGRHLRMLSVHGDSERDYRVEMHQVFLADHLEMEDILESEEIDAWGGAGEVEQLMGLPVRRVAWASRKADYGFQAAKTPYYRAVLAALHTARTMPERLVWHPQAAPNGPVSRLGYHELLPSGASL